MASRTFSTRSSTSATLAPPFICHECHKALHPPHVIYLVEDAPKDSYRCYTCQTTSKAQRALLEVARTMDEGRRDKTPSTPQGRTGSRPESLWKRVSAAVQSVVRLQGSKEDDKLQSAPRRGYFPDGGP